MADAHKNFAWSTVATAPSPATSGTSLVVGAGEGAGFPAVPFNATICPAGTQPTNANAEIVRVTARSTDTFTITRAQESTSARTVVVGDQVFAAVTAKALTDIEVTAAASVLFKSGAYSFLQPGTAGTLAHGVGALQLSAVFVPRPVTLTRIGAEVTVVAGAGDAGATMILAVYSDDGAGYPGALLFDSSASGSASTILGNGLIDLRSATVQEITCSIPLNPGLYWAGSVCQNAAHDGTAFGTAPTLRIAPGNASVSQVVSTTIPTAGAAWNGFGYRQLSVFSTLPSTLTTTFNLPGGGLPRLFAKAA